MNSSKISLLAQIKKNAIYAVYGNSKIVEKGMALVVLDISEDDVHGLGVGIITPKNFKINKEQFLNEIEKGTYLFVEVLPKFVVKEMKGIYKNNLKN